MGSRRFWLFNDIKNLIKAGLLTRSWAHEAKAKAEAEASHHEAEAKAEATH